MTQTIEEKDLLPSCVIPHENWVKDKIAYHILTLYKSGIVNPAEQYGKTINSMDNVFPLECRFTAGCVTFWIKQLGPKRPALIFGQLMIKHRVKGVQESFEDRRIRHFAGYDWDRVIIPEFYTSTGPARRTQHDGVIPDGFILKAAGQAYEVALETFRRVRAIVVLDQMVSEELELIGCLEFEKESVHLAEQYGTRYRRMPLGAALAWLDWLKQRKIGRLEFDPSDWINESEEKIFDVD